MKKITPVQVERMRALSKRGLSHHAIAEKIGCSRQSVDTKLARGQRTPRSRRNVPARSNGSHRFTTLEGFVDSIRSTERERIKASILRVIG